MTDDSKPDPTCLHCRISTAVIEHFREQQKRAPDQYPELGAAETREILVNLAQVVADVITPFETEQQLLQRVTTFTAKVLRCAHQDKGSSTVETSVVDISTRLH